MKLRVAFVSAAGICVALYLLSQIGWGSVFSAVITVGWNGLVVICLLALGLFLILGAACYVLRPRSNDWRLPTLVWSRMVRDSASEVLPFAQLGGLLLGARAAILRGVPTHVAFAALIADITTEMLAEIAYVALGLALIVDQLPASPHLAALLTPVIVGLLLAGFAGALLLTLPRYADAVIKAVVTRFLPDAAAGLDQVTASLRTIYRSRARLMLSVGLHWGAWLASAASAWIAFRLMGVRLNFGSVLGIETLVAVSRSVAVVIPNALGVQEAAYAVLMPLFGIGAEWGLAMSLLKRVRDTIVGIPILLIWQGAEARRLLERANDGTAGSGAQPSPRV